MDSRILARFLTLSVQQPQNLLLIWKLIFVFALFLKNLQKIWIICSPYLHHRNSYFPCSNWDRISTIWSEDISSWWLEVCWEVNSVCMLSTTIIPHEALFEWETEIGSKINHGLQKTCGGIKRQPKELIITENKLLRSCMLKVHGLILRIELFYSNELSLPITHKILVSYFSSIYSVKILVKLFGYMKRLRIYCTCLYLIV